MAKPRTPKNQKDDVSTKQWWQTQLFAALVGAMVGLTPTIYDKIQQNDEKRDAIGMTFLTQGFPGPFTWTNSNKKSFSVRLIGVSFGESDSWIMLNIGTEKVKIGRGMHNGQFAVFVDNLVCDTTYYYRTEAMREGRVAAGPLTNLYFPKCSTQAEIAATESDPNFLSDPKRLRDPNLPIGHPLPGGFGDEIRHTKTGPNRGTGSPSESKESK